MNSLLAAAIATVLCSGCSTSTEYDRLSAIACRDYDAVNAGAYCRGQIRASAPNYYRRIQVRETVNRLGR